MKNIMVLFLSLLMICCSKDNENQQIQNNNPVETNKSTISAVSLYSKIEIAYKTYNYDIIPDLYIKLTNEYPNYSGISEASKMYSYATNKELIKKDADLREKNEEKKEKLFEHYFSYNMYSNSTMPVKIHEEIIALVAKANNVSEKEFSQLYNDYYREWYNERIKKISY
ncbi:hypothetical protein [Brachyspira pilosicoli]|uniref:hypothetical protein n=1 Tax=Brachyspira pilosicoli TaxID=52584 RepID=UPI0012F51DA5|nr:hypothetical protein [Brachyspira pilosicoli]